MALGRRNELQQGELWVATQQLPTSPGHVFYEKLNGLLAEGKFDEWVENLCEQYYAQKRPARHSARRLLSDVADRLLRKALVRNGALLGGAVTSLSRASSWESPPLKNPQTIRRCR